MNLTQAQKVYEKLFQRRKLLYADYNYVFNTPEGQRVLADICEMGYISKSTFNPSCPDKTNLNEGSRLLALSILKKLNKKPVEAVTEAIIGD